MTINYNKNFVLHRDGRPGIMLSDAIGLDKMKPLIQSFVNDYSDVNRLVQLNLGTNGFLYKEELDQWDNEEIRFSSYYLPEINIFYEKINTELQKIMFQTGITPNIYIAGLDSFVELVYSAIEQSGYNKDNIIVANKEEVPSCGGGCNSCVSGC